ncbi:hypothetical protein [Sphaerisporangium rubeum]|uniref:Uncharacterized protein n=1 Tax=Sphaerisporangium rubeum TaxID=321317 RepID=A0A7X0IB00_9ACTN|nr:hypothetical protein [Sphaerisporangium rubeum]MBB6471884.1 hypothetical protein [Sphaerisporangium rubeum]
MGSYSLDDVRAARARGASWWTAHLVDPVAGRLALLAGNHTRVAPAGLTRASPLLGLGAAACFATGRFAAGALLFHLSVAAVRAAGVLAGLRGTVPPAGRWQDHMRDRVRVVCCACGLAYGLYAATGRPVYVLLGVVVAVLDLVRHVDTPRLRPPRRPAEPGLADAPDDRPPSRPTARPEFVSPFGPMIQMTEPRAAAGPARAAPGLSHAPPEHPAAPPPVLAWRSHGPLGPRVGDGEFHAAVFVLAPLAGPGASLVVAAVACASLVLGEIVLIHRTRRVSRAVAARAGGPAPASAAGPRLRTDPFRTEVEFR